MATTPTTWNNGLPLDSTGALCISTNAIQTWENGIPFDSAGAVVVNNGGGINKWPVFALDFSTGVLDSRVTFTRASGGTYTDSTGTIQLATTNTPRFDYDPVTLAAKGLLIEEQRTNLLTYSDQFDNAAWVKTSATVTANATTAPDGATTADKLVEDTSTAIHYIDNVAVSVVSGTTYTASFFVKAAGRTTLSAYLIDSGIIANTTSKFNLTTGVVTSGAQASIIAYGNGWFRCTIYGTMASTTARLRIFPNTEASYTGDGTSGLYIWGAQLEAGSFATSYIPTTTAQATRAADVAVVTGTNFSSWYNQSEGTLYVAYAGTSGNNTRRALSIMDGTPSNVIQIVASNADGSLGNYAEIITSGASQAALVSGGYLAGNQFSALAYKTNDIAFSKNGNAVLTDTSAVIPSVNQLGIGTAFSQYLNGHIKSLAYWNTRLTNTQLQTITA